MNNWKNIILPGYEIRKTNEQKNAFIDMLKGKYGEQMRLEESGRIKKSRNIIFGSPETAKTVFTAHYDTCSVMPFPNFITPMNLPVYILYQLLISVVLYAPVILALILVVNLTADLPEPWGLIIYEFTLFAGLFGVMALMLAGPANKHTANDNTSGVVTVLTLLDKLGTDADYAFILFDNEEIGMRGSKAYASAHPNVKNNALIINLDCVSDGDNIMLYRSKTVKNDTYCNEIIKTAPAVFSEFGKNALVPKTFTFYPSDQVSFKRYIALSALKKSKLVGYYMDKIHTPKDVEFDENNIRAIVELFSTKKSA